MAVAQQADTEALEPGAYERLAFEAADTDGDGRAVAAKGATPLLLFSAGSTATKRVSDPEELGPHDPERFAQVAPTAMALSFSECQANHKIPRLKPATTTMTWRAVLRRDGRICVRRSEQQRPACGTWRGQDASPCRSVSLLRRSPAAQALAERPPRIGAPWAGAAAGAGAGRLLFGNNATGMLIGGRRAALPAT